MINIGQTVNRARTTGIVIAGALICWLLYINIARAKGSSSLGFPFLTPPSSKKVTPIEEAKKKANLINSSNVTGNTYGVQDGNGVFQVGIEYNEYE